MTSNDPSCEEELPEIKVRTAEDVIKQVKGMLQDRGNFGLRGLARVFKQMVDNGNQTLDKEDFKWGLYNYQIYLDEPEIDILIKKFDKNKDGVVDFNEFLVGIKGGLSPNRENIVLRAY